MAGRKELATWAFALILIIELFSANVIIFKSVFAEPSSYDLLSVITGPPRWIVSIMVSYMLVGGEMWRYLILLDNQMLLGTLSVTCYFFFMLQGEETTALNVIAWLNYLILVFLYNGHFRVLMKKLEWSSSRVIAYKLNKMYYAALYIGLAAFNTVNKNLGEAREMYLLFVITTSVYLSEFIFAMSVRDGTHHVEWHYEIKDEENHGHGGHHDSSKNVELTIS